jgi:ribonuclease Z
MKFQIIFLGTSGSVPTKKRNHTGIFIKTEKENILLDCGEGIQRQFKIAGINASRLTKLLLTHWHADHSLGFTGLLSSLNMNNYSKELQIFGPKETKEKIKLLEKVYGTFKIKKQVKEMSESFFETDEITINTSKMLHRIPTIAYSITLKDKIKINKEKLKKSGLPNSSLIKNLQQGKDITYKGKKIKSSSLTHVEKGKKITIILDTTINENAVALAKNSDLLICESTFLNEEEEKAIEYKHLTSKQAAQIAKNSNSKKLILTHISQKNETKTKKILEEAKKIFHNTSIVKDFDKVEI